MEVLQYDGLYRKTKIGYLYIATDGTHPDEAEKAVMLPNIKFANINKYARHKTVCTFLGINSGMASIYRISQAQEQGTWTAIDTRDNDYCINQFNELLEKLQEDYPLLLTSGVWREAVSQVYGVSTMTLRRLSDPFTQGIANEERYRELRFSAAGLTYFRYLHQQMKGANFTVTDLGRADEEHEVGETYKEGATTLVFKMNTGRKVMVKFADTKPDFSLQNGTFHNNNPLWRIKLKSKETYNYFYSTNLIKSDGVVEFARQNGLEPFSSVLTEGSKTNLASMYAPKASRERLHALMEMVDIEVLEDDLSWRDVADYLSSEQESTLNEKQCEELYGMRVFYPLVVGLSHPKNEPQNGQEDRLKFMRWCESRKPTFIDYQQHTTGEVKVKKVQRRRKASVLDYKRQNKPTSTKLIDERQKSALALFSEQWSKLHSILNVAEPTVVPNMIHDTSNKQTEFKLTDEGSSIALQINSGCLMYKVEPDKELAGTPTIAYNEPKFDVDGTFTLEAYLTQKSAETIAKYVTGHELTYGKAIHDISTTSLEQWKKDSTRLIVSLLNS
ncbi:hypothetical protein L1D14_03870 [Vibrio tubiashii]|uniref:hypothetical protein n=1 Tax=Vibrio tubiashii TaxID=29498 RepID=UPI001EFC3256|nr:hypothetical protein [Vibrio tubiashii]MCG9575368.1 hypothetical protein [Vibrio tubiashii]